MFCSTLWRLVGSENVEKALPVLAVALVADVDRGVVALNCDPGVTDHDALAPTDPVIYLASGKVQGERSAVGIAVVIGVCDDPHSLHTASEGLERDHKSGCGLAVVRRQIHISEHGVERRKIELGGHVAPGIAASNGGDLLEEVREGLHDGHVMLSEQKTGGFLMEWAVFDDENLHL